MTGSYLEGFFLRLLDELGVPHESVAPGVHEALFPAELAREAQVAEHLKLSTDPEAVAEEAGVELLAPGSPLMDWAMARAAAVGRFSRRHVSVRSLDLEACRSKVERELGLDRIRLAGWAAGEVELAQVLGMEWLVDLPGDLDAESAAWVYVDAATGRPWDVWSSGSAPDGDAEPVYAGTSAAVLPLDRLIDAGRRLADGAFGATLSSLRAQLARERALEEERLARYFAAQRDELSGRRLGPQALSGRLAALAAEEGVRRSELEARAALDVRVSLDALVLFETPVARLSARLEMGRRQWTQDLRVDLWSGRIVAVPCPSCDAPTRALLGRRDGEPMCGACRPATAEPAEGTVAAAGAEPDREEERGATVGATEAGPRHAGGPDPAARREPAVEQAPSGLAFLRQEPGVCTASLHGLLLLVCAPARATEAAERQRRLRRLELDRISRCWEEGRALPGFGVPAVERAGRSYRVRGAGAVLLEHLQCRPPGFASGPERTAAQVAGGIAAEHLAAQGRAISSRGFSVPWEDTGARIEWHPHPDGPHLLAILGLWVVTLGTNDAIRATRAHTPRAERLAPIVQAVAANLGLSGRHAWVSVLTVVSAESDDAVRIHLARKTILARPDVAVSSPPDPDRRMFPSPAALIAAVPRAPAPSRARARAPDPAPGPDGQGRPF
jgi:hypothetical protein